MGDSLLETVSKGLRECHYGIVVFSPNSIAKKWPREELAGLVARETVERKIILPIWHKLGRKEILEHLSDVCRQNCIQTLFALQHRDEQSRLSHSQQLPKDVFHRAMRGDNLRFPALLERL
jgi:TIR domain